MLSMKDKRELLYIINAKTYTYINICFATVFIVSNERQLVLLKFPDKSKFSIA